MRSGLISFGVAGCFLFQLAFSQEAVDATDSQDSSAISEILQQTYLGLERALELEKEGKYQEALEKCDQVNLLYRALVAKHPSFQPEKMKLKQHAALEIAGRIAENLTTARNVAGLDAESPNSNPLVHNYHIPDQIFSEMPILVDQNKVAYAARNWTPSTKYTYSMPILRSKIKAENIVR